MFVVTLCERDEYVAKPLNTDVIVRPALVQGGNPEKEKKKGGVSCGHALAS